MPLYEFELCEGDCKACGGRFTLRRPLDAKPLTQCPACRKPVRKVFGTDQRGLHRLEASGQGGIREAHAQAQRPGREREAAEGVSVAFP